MRLSLRRISKDQEGTTAIEYVLIATVVSVTVITSMHATGESLDGFFRKVAEVLSLATPPSTP